LRDQASDSSRGEHGQREADERRRKEPEGVRLHFGSLEPGTVKAQFAELGLRISNS
jgi:hypothetical protein